MTYKTNFMDGSTNEKDEILAYEEICDYLVKLGMYDDTAEADTDAIERVYTFEEAGIYNEDSQLSGASIYRKKTHALIYAHDLHSVITENNGYLPDPKTNARTKEDSRLKLAGLLMSEIESGASRKDIIERLILNGMEPGKIEAFVDTAFSTRENHFSHHYAHIAKFVIFSVVTFTICFWSLTHFLSKEELVQFAKYDAAIFAFFFIVFGLLVKVGGKVATYFRFGISYFLLIAVSILSGLLFLQEDWGETAIRVSGNVFFIVIISIVNFVFSIGPFWVGVICSLLSLLMLMLAWGESYRIREHDYDALD